MSAACPAPFLVLGIGNPSRGDDALGSLFIERLEIALEPELRAGHVELLTDFQLQVEHALDLVGRRRVVFVDASVKASPPFEYKPVRAERDASHSSHAMTPAAVLHAFERVVGEPPPSWVLAIRGERFELGEPLSASAAEHLEFAIDFLVEELRCLAARESLGATTVAQTPEELSRALT